MGSYTCHHFVLRVFTGLFLVGADLEEADFFWAFLGDTRDGDMITGLGVTTGGSVALFSLMSGEA